MWWHTGPRGLFVHWPLRLVFSPPLPSACNPPCHPLRVFSNPLALGLSRPPHCLRGPARVVHPSPTQSSFPKSHTTAVQHLVPTLAPLPLLPHPSSVAPNCSRHSTEYSVLPAEYLTRAPNFLSTMTCKPPAADFLAN